MNEKIINKNKIRKNLKKINPRGGISLIVLVITIIVVIILAAAVIVSLINNNPLSEANKARYQSDRANMQAILTNTIGKIMAEKEEIIEIVPKNLNSKISGVNSIEGETEYKINGEVVGKIIFDNKPNKNNNYYTGKKLPIYNSETVWNITKDGMLMLNVGDINIADNDNTQNNDNEAEKNDDIKQRLDLLSARVTDLEEKNELLEGLIDNLSNSTKILKRRVFGKSDIASKNDEWIILDKISFKGNGTGKAIISLSLSNMENPLSCLQLEIVNSGKYELYGTDSDTFNNEKTYLRTSTVAIVPFDEETVVDLRVYTDKSINPYYGYSVLIIKD